MVSYAGPTGGICGDTSIEGNGDIGTETVVEVNTVGTARVTCISARLPKRPGSVGPHSWSYNALTIKFECRNAMRNAALGSISRPLFQGTCVFPCRGQRDETGSFLVEKPFVD